MPNSRNHCRLIWLRMSGFGHLTFNVLLSCLLRELYPDPEVACRYTVTTQFDFIANFAEGLVISTVYGTEVYQPLKERARTREELSTSLRYRSLMTDRMVDCPERVKMYVTLLNGAVPTICFGGARYLHLVRGHYVYQHHVLHLSQLMPHLYQQDITAGNKTHIRFSRSDLELTNLPGMDRAIDWAAGIMAEVQESLEYPTALVVHRGLKDSVADYRVEAASKNSMFTKFWSEALRTGRPMRFLLSEWICTDLARQAPLFIGLFEGSKTFFLRFKGYADTICQMYVLATNRPPLNLPDRLADRAQTLEDQVEEQKDKLWRLQAAMVQQQKVVEELTNPWKSLDSDVLQTKPVSLPRTAGVVHPDRVILPVGRWRNRGRDITAVEAEHDDEITAQQVEVTQP